MEHKVRNFHMILSHLTDYGIGFEMTKPWYIKNNIKFFKNITTSYKMPGQKHNGINAVIMGRNTFEHILKKAFLWDRINVIVSKKNYG